LTALLFVTSIARADEVEMERRLKAIGVDGALREKIHRSIDRGVAFLLARQQPDGWFVEHSEAERTPEYSREGVSLLCSLALRHAGGRAVDLALKKAISAVFSNESSVTAKIEKRVYEGSIALMLLAAVPGHESIARRLASALVRGLDKSTGLWGYDTLGADDDYSDGLAPRSNRESPNLSTSQFAALGLVAARRMELPVPPSVWIRHAEGLCALQMDNGSWPYQPGNVADAMHSVTATYMGLANLLLAAERLAGTKDVPAGLAERISKAVLLARGALARGAKKTLAGPRAMGADYDDGSTAPTLRRQQDGIRRPAYPGIGAYYTLFAFEKACIFGNVESFDTADSLLAKGKPAAKPSAVRRLWYSAGAEWLLSVQGRDGGWPPSGGDPPEESSSEIDSALALLFLLRSPSVFHPTTPSGVDARAGGAITDGEPTAPSK
jgi:hypothetical protein